MKEESYRIVPYTEEFLPGVTELEKGILQGRGVKLELVKEHFLDRARVFKKYYPCIALSGKQDVIGMTIGARTKLIVNDVPVDAGIAFDAKTHPAWRNRGVGTLLARSVYECFFNPEGLDKNIMTAKKNNAPILRLASRTIKKTWIYDFLYLAIPTSARIKPYKNSGKEPQRFNVRLIDREEVSGDYYAHTNSGLGYFHTNKMYRLRINKIDWRYRSGIAILKSINPAKYQSLPRQDDLLSFATLFDHCTENVNGVNEVLEELRRQSIGQLLVCCKKNDAIYKALNRSAIHEYKYALVSDFKLEKSDRVTVDVRCL